MLDKMTIQDAVKIATKHGYRYMGEKLKWDDNAGWFYIKTDNGGMAIGCIEKIILDPKFWEALGKEYGWGNLVDLTDDYKEVDKIHEWVKSRMYQMINALIEGKTLEGFFEEL